MGSPEQITPDGQETTSRAASEEESTSQPVSSEQVATSTADVLETVIGDIEEGQEMGPNGVNHSGNGEIGGDGEKD